MGTRYTRDMMSATLGVNGALLMLDALTVDASAGRAAGRKLSSISESHFTGHFPGQPVMPGVLQVAAMVQASQLLFNELYPGDGPAVLLGLKRVKFRTPVVPGMVIALECERKDVLEDGTVEFAVKNLCEDGKTASSGSVLIGRRPGWYDVFDTDEGTNPVMESVAECTEYKTATEIMKAIPHRYPFMFVDRAYDWSDLSSVMGFKQVTGSELYVSSNRMSEFAGYLQIEALAQLGCAALLTQPSMEGKLGFFMSIDDAVFHRPVLAGTRLWEHLHCEQKGSFGIAGGMIYAGGQCVTEANVKFAIVERS